MDDWNRYSIDPEDQPKDDETPTQEPSYSSYGWNQTPYAPPPPPKKKNSGTVVAVVIGVVCVLVLGTLAALMVMVTLNGDSRDSSGKTTASDETTTSTTVSDEAEGNSPATSNKTSTTKRDPEDLPTLTIPEKGEALEGLSTREIVSNNLDSTVLLTIYAESSGGSFGYGGSAQEVQTGVASGFVLSEDGYIATNWHCVVDESTNQPFARVDVTMYDGTVYEDAELIGADSSTDLAVIKVDASGLKAAELGNSDALQLGDRVVALGNAGGLGFSATEGILSGLARDVYEDTGYAIKCFQVDAAINPGNSGGPLFNAAGQVVAVNSAKIAATGYEGLGFSIPINEAVKIFDELMLNGYVTGRVALGITGQSYDDGYYAGFLIYTVEDGSPLEDTEANPGDLITAVDDTAVTDYATLRAALSQHSVGDTVTLTLLRSSGRRVESFEVDVVLAEFKG